MNTTEQNLLATDKLASHVTGQAVRRSAPTKPEQSTKIALCIPNLEAAGAERVTVLLANGLVRRGYSVDVVLVQAKGAFVADLCDEVRIVNLKASGSMAAIPSLAAYLRKRRPTVMISALEQMNIAAVIANRLSCTGTPLVSAVHNSQAAASRRWPDIRGDLFSHCVNWSYRRASALVCVSQGVAEDIVRITGIPRTRIRVIYNPVIHPRLQELASQAVEHPWFQSRQSKILLAVGRLRPQKDFPMLLQALKVVRQTQDVRLVILGEGEERQRLESLAKELGLESSVSMPGVVGNPYAYMAKSDLFVLSSAWEALPTVLIEALAVGAPVVATDCVSGPREILKDGLYGTLVAIGSATALAEAILAALKAPRRELPRQAIDRYTIDSAVDEYCRLIEEVKHA